MTFFQNPRLAIRAIGLFRAVKVKYERKLRNKGFGMTGKSVTFSILGRSII